MFPQYEEDRPAEVASSVGRVRLPASLVNFMKSSRRKEATAPSRRSTRVGRGQRYTGNAPAPLSRLLSLPREIRDCIYDFAFQGSSGTVIMFRHGNMKFAAAYGTKYHETYWDSGYRKIFKRSLRVELPTWLGMNKQILVEALELFHRNARFFYMNDLDEPLHQHLAAPRHLSLTHARLVDLTAATIPCLFVLQHWRTSSGDKGYAFGFDGDEKAILQQAIYYMMDPSTAVVSLSFRFSVDTHLLGDVDPSIQDIRSWIQFIGQIPKPLLRVSFELQNLRDAPDVDKLDHVHAAIKAEMRRLALALVDSDGVECKESEGCLEHGAFPCSKCRSNIFEDVERVWRFEVTSAAYRRTLTRDHI
jgi:hypothetical protein